jgi:hypothetical protein
VGAAAETLAWGGEGEEENGWAGPLGLGSGGRERAICGSFLPNNGRS